eukprot:scaffold1687_cov405-Prasinococcus_capsulatus_cf.AAC.40
MAVTLQDFLSVVSQFARDKPALAVAIVALLWPVVCVFAFGLLLLSPILLVGGLALHFQLWNPQLPAPVTQAAGGAPRKKAVEAAPVPQYKLLPDQRKTTAPGSTRD